MRACVVLNNCFNCALLLYLCTHCPESGLNPAPTPDVKVVGHEGATHKLSTAREFHHLLKNTDSYATVHFNVTSAILISNTGSSEYVF